jgi:hypothetical protein
LQENAASDSQAAAFGSCENGYGSHLIWGDDGQLNHGWYRKIARTYAMFVPGDATKMSSDAASAAFKLTIAIDVDSDRSGCVRPPEPELSVGDEGGGG